MLSVTFPSEGIPNQQVSYRRMLWHVRRMQTTELIKHLKGLAETAEVCIDDGGGGLLPITNPHMASAKEKADAGLNPNELVVVIPAKTGLEQ